MKDLIRNPAIIIFLITILGSVIAWGIRQEIINRVQQSTLDRIERQLAK